MATFLITTTGATSPVVINDLGARSFTHLTSAFDLTDEYQIEELRDSEDLRAAIDGGDLTATLDGVSITTGALFDSVMEDFLNARVTQNETDITTLQTQVSQLEKGGRRIKKVLAVVDATAVPPTEVSGDRYWLDFSGAPNAAWDGNAQGDIVEFDGATWVYGGVGTAMEEGDVAYDDTTNNDWVYLDDGGASLEERNGLLEQNATQVPYTPTTPADWDVTPTEVGGALDELADRVEDLEGAVVPTKRSWTWSAGDNRKLNGSRDLQRSGGITTNQSPFRAPYTGVIHAVSVQSELGVSETYDVEILVNGTTVPALTQSVSASDGIETNGLTAAVTKGDLVRIRFIKTSGNIRDLGVEVYGIES